MKHLCDFLRGLDKINELIFELKVENFQSFMKITIGIQNIDSIRSIMALKDFVKGMAIGILRCGGKTTDVARSSAASRTIVARWWKR